MVMNIIMDCYFLFFHSGVLSGSGQQSASRGGRSAFWTDSREWHPMSLRETAACGAQRLSTVTGPQFSEAMK